MFQSSSHSTHNESVFQSAPSANNFLFGASAATRFNPNFLAIPSLPEHADSAKGSCLYLQKLRSSHLIRSDSVSQEPPRARRIKPRKDTTIHVTGAPRPGTARPQLDLLAVKQMKVKDPVAFHDWFANRHYVTQSCVIGEGHEVALNKRSVVLSHLVEAAKSVSGDEPRSSVARQQGGIHFLRALADKNRSESRDRFTNPCLASKHRQALPTKPQEHTIFSKVFEA